MANIKNLNNLVKALNETTNETLAAIINNEAVDAGTLNDRQKLATLAFEQICRAVSNKEVKLVMDCNYANSGHHNHEDEGEDEYKVDYWAVVPVANPNVRMMQIKVTKVSTVPDSEALIFKIHTSCKKITREMLQAMEDDLHFKVVYNSKTQKPKTSTRKDVPYSELVATIKAVLAVLADAGKKSEAEKEERAKKRAEEKAAKKEEKKEMTVEDMVNTIADALSKEVA